MGGLRNKHNTIKGWMLVYFEENLPKVVSSLFSLFSLQDYSEFSMDILLCRSKPVLLLIFVFFD
jgi:hypothetical protein